MISASQVADYERDGFIRIRKFLSADELAQLKSEIDRYSHQVLPGLPESDRVLEADGKSVRNLWRMEKHDRFFDEFSRRPGIVSTVRPLVHGTPVLVGAETFNKPAKIGSAVPAHQDNAYFCQTPADVLTIWIAVDAVTLENGPIYYVKGTHKQGMLPHKPSGVTGNSMGLAQMPPAEESDKFCGTLDPGDALIHHCHTIHYSAPNKSDRNRCGFLLVYRGEHTKYDPQFKAAYTQAQAK
ncbi:MAG: phytanoyl-CoA dioxygenase family protein [Phycisphaerales bacterium]|nr:phytanoyl-CoA dioxygenase family protein [Phycisphaerales bacterium]